jgi:hypothetical protein
VQPPENHRRGDDEIALRRTELAGRFPRPRQLVESGKRWVGAARFGQRRRLVRLTSRAFRCRSRSRSCG